MNAMACLHAVLLVVVGWLVLVRTAPESCGPVAGCVLLVGWLVLLVQIACTCTQCVCSD